GIVLLGVSMMLVGLGLYVTHQLDVSLEDGMFVKSYQAAEKLNEYVASPSKRRSRWAAKKRLRTLSYLVERNWNLRFKLAKELLGPVDELTKILRDKVLYSVERGKQENVVAPLDTLKRSEL